MKAACLTCAQHGKELDFDWKVKNHFQNVGLHKWEAQVPESISHGDFSRAAKELLRFFYGRGHEILQSMGWERGVGVGLQAGTQALTPENTIPIQGEFAYRLALRKKSQGKTRARAGAKAIVFHSRAYTPGRSSVKPLCRCSWTSI